MKSSAVRVGATALALTAALLAGGCSNDDGGSQPPPAPELEPQEPRQAGPGEVPDVTSLVLETAQGNLGQFQVEIAVVDADGQPVDVEDATAWRVVAQDPAEGMVGPGDTVTLTVEPRG